MVCRVFSSLRLLTKWRMRWLASLVLSTLVVRLWVLASVGLGGLRALEVRTRGMWLNSLEMILGASMLGAVLWQTTLCITSPGPAWFRYALVIVLNMRLMVFLQL